MFNHNAQKVYKLHLLVTKVLKDLFVTKNTKGLEKVETFKKSVENLMNPSFDMTVLLIKFMRLRGVRLTSKRRVTNTTAPIVRLLDSRQLFKHVKLT